MSNRLQARKYTFILYHTERTEFNSAKYFAKNRTVKLFLQWQIYTVKVNINFGQVIRNFSQNKPFLTNYIWSI